MKVHHRQLQSMGTRLDLVIADVEQKRCEALAKDMKAELDRIEGMLSIYRPDSVVSLINSTAHAGIIELDSEFQNIFREIVDLHRETGGYFDITLKPVSDFFREHTGLDLPLPRNIAEVAGIDKLILVPGGIRFSGKGVTIDLGGYGKGYAVEKVLPILEYHRIEHALISFGESLVYGWGTHPIGKAWSISVPGIKGTDPVVFDLKNSALSTSGNSLNNKKKFGNSGHIVNPVTLRMASKRGQVCVKSKDPVRAEVFSTALFSAGPGLSGKVLQESPDLEICWILTEE